jgi:Helix-turn-helix domain
VELDLGLEPAGRFEWERLIRRARLDASVMLVALTLATYANGDGSSVKPGLKRLMNVTGYSKATICRALARLRELGLLGYVFQASKDGREGTADEYQLTFPLDLFQRIEMLGPEEERPEIMHNQVSGVRPGSGQTGLSARSHQCDDQVSPVRRPGLTGETPQEQDQPIDHPATVVPDLNGHRGSSEVIHSGPSASQIELAAWNAIRERS